MYHHFDVAMYAGDLSYRILLEGSNEEIDLAADDRANETFYADYFLPLTTTSEGDLDILLFSLAPVAPDRNKAALTPAPLPGPPGVIYAMHLHNNGSQAIKGKVILQTGDLLLGHYEDVKPELRAHKAAAGRFTPANPDPDQTRRLGWHSPAQRQMDKAGCTLPGRNRLYNRSR
jgi:hypothetical protein